MLKTSDVLPQTGIVCDGTSPPSALVGDDGDIVFDGSKQLLYVKFDGKWRGPFYLFNKPASPCSISGNHVIKQQNDSYVQYIDGMMVGNCDDCNDRITFPYAPGGMDVPYLRDMAAGLLIDSSTADRCEQYFDSVRQVREYHEALTEVLSEAETVTHVLQSRGHDFYGFHINPKKAQS